MTKDPHYLALENLYAAAPINAFYNPTIEVTQSTATIEIAVAEKFFHAADAVHGSVYFKMLDDAAYFAASSLEREVFILTTSFTTYLTRPVSAGTLRAVGRVVNRTRTQFIAEAVAYDGEGNEVGRGSGIFVRGKVPWAKTRGYASS